MRRLVLLAAFAAAVLSATAPALGVPAHPLVRTSAPAEAYVSAGGAPQSAGVIVRFKSTQTAPLAAELLSAATSTTAQVTNRAAGLYTFSSPVTATDEQYAIQLMLAGSGVVVAEPNYLRHIMSYTAPTDPEVLLRVVESPDAMTADWAKLPHALLQKISGRITNEVRGVGRVVFDISSKPPATIEWE